MRIAYFNANLRVGQDGVTRVVYKMIDGALARNHDVMAITSTLPEQQDPAIRFHKVPSVVLPLQKNYRIAYPGFQHFETELREFRPDVLHINSPCTLGFAAAKFAQQFHVPIVATYHTHFPTYPRYYHLTKFEQLTWKISRSLYNGMDRTFVPTRPILDELLAHDIQRLEYLPNGVDVNLFGPHRRSQEWRSQFDGGNKPIILFVSRLVWEKDLRVLAGMHELLRSRRNDFVMVIVGDGHARAELERMMPGAHFLGYQSGTTLATSFASSDIFVFPSTTETFGLVTLEAMASRLAPVAAKIGGAEELLEQGKSGLFSVPFSAEDLARKVESLLDYPRFRQSISEQAHGRAQHYRWEKILGRLFDAYQEVVQTHKLLQLRRAA
ncbi:MAG TPA: glycosyltransferase family 1 protein [Bacteroidota bacterium]|nr:glycosyltransferase family 1 protein [Bacteroidota bacterium]